MDNLEEAIERIKILECPTGEVENRVLNILADYNVANREVINISRQENDDGDGLEEYSAVIPGSNQQSIRVLAKSGLDDYVATVIDAYIE